MNDKNKIIIIALIAPNVLKALSMNQDTERTRKSLNTLNNVNVTVTLKILETSRCQL